MRKSERNEISRTRSGIEQTHHHFVVNSLEENKFLTHCHGISYRYAYTYTHTEVAPSSDGRRPGRRREDTVTDLIFTYARSLLPSGCQL